MPRGPLHSAAGFTLPEVLIAAGILSTALVGLAGLFTLSIEANLSSRHRTFATVLAQQKLEELRSIRVPAAAAPIPIAGIDFVDQNGRVVTPAPDPGAGVYARRWWIEPLAAAPSQAIVIRVVVVRGSSDPSAADRALLVTVMRTGAP